MNENLQTDSRTGEAPPGSLERMVGPLAVYENLGNISAVDGWASVGLCCDVCLVEWVGCWDMAACPRCGNHDSWDRLMEARGYYEAKRPNVDLSHTPPKNQKPL